MKIKLFKQKTTKKDMISNIFSEVVKKDKTVKRPMLLSQDGEWIIQYQQGRQKYIISIDEVFDLK